MHFHTGIGKMLKANASSGRINVGSGITNIEDQVYLCTRSLLGNVGPVLLPQPKHRTPVGKKTIRTESDMFFLEQL